MSPRLLTTFLVMLAFKCQNFYDYYLIKIKVIGKLLMN